MDHSLFQVASKFVLIQLAENKRREQID